MDLSTPIGKLPTIGPVYVRRLAKLDIYTVNDLLSHFPFRYDDFSLISKIARVQEGEIVTIQGKITSIKNEFTRGHRFIQKANVSDETGSIDVVWFNQTYLTRSLPAGTPVSLAGKVSTFKNQRALVSPAFEIFDPPVFDPESSIRMAGGTTIHTGRLVPIYPETYGVSSKWLRTKIYQILAQYLSQLVEYLPDEMVKRHQLMHYADAIEHIHFPQNQHEATLSRERLAFDEFFLMHVSSLLRRSNWEQKRQAKALSIAKFTREISTFWERLPFELTNAQKQAVKVLFADLAKQRPMNRLLEGDVGSGKTVVAAIGMYLAYLNGLQSVLMAPTQILANQHFDTISKLLTPLGVNVHLITGGKKLEVRSKKLDILIGTHALLSDSVKLKKLAFIVIDEQHRFGVEQRGLLLQKGGATHTPHVLTMTATPIPRTVALTMYGDLDFSYLDEMPKGRVTVKTWVVPPFKRGGAYNWIVDKIIKEDAQVFIICPFIEESETQTTVKAAKKEYELLKRTVFKNQRLGLLHGKMKAKEKEKEMNSFRDQKLDILVATPVVEVGIDIPSATIIIIEGSERFGLAQLHQLRGRVGRSTMQSYCLLFTDSQNHETLRRLKYLEHNHVGAQLAQFDLTLRGPGELTGTRQHGTPDLKIASFSDSLLIEKTRKEAVLLFKKDPMLKTLSPLKEKLKTFTIQTIEPN